MAGTHTYFANGFLVHNCDDPHNVLKVESDTERFRTTEYVRGVMGVRGIIRNVRRVCIMQRLHGADVSQLFIDQGDWVHLCFPMRFEAPAVVQVPGGIDKLVPRMPVTPLGFQDPRTVDGELMWPSVYTEEKVATMEANLGIYHAAAQLQQRPAPRGGGTLKRVWFEVIATLPACTRWVRYWDKAGTKIAKGTAQAATRAQTAGVLIGEYVDPAVQDPRSPMRTKYVIADVVTAQLGAAERETLIKQTATLDKARYGYVQTWVEQEPGSGGKESVENTVANLAGFTCFYERVTGSKEVRCEPLASQASVGKVKVLAADWTEEYLQELDMFPLGRRKDKADASGGAFNKLWAPTGSFTSAEGIFTGARDDGMDLGGAERLGRSDL